MGKGLEECGGEEGYEKKFEEIHFFRWRINLKDLIGLVGFIGD